MKHKNRKKASTKDILAMIRERQQGNPNMNDWKLKWKSQILGDTSMDEEDIPWNPLNADQWQQFKKDFVEEYGGEKVQDTGMTHTEFLRYMKDSYREGDENNIANSRLRAFLADLGT